MLHLLRMAYRNLGRNRRRSLFSALALGLGLALLLLMASVVRGEYRDAMLASITLQTGHLQVRAQSYDEDKTSLAWEDLVENPERIATQIASLPPVKAATPRLFASGILVKGDETAGVRIIGIDPLSEANAPYREGVIEGEFLTPEDREGILIGHSLASKLNLKAGDQVHLMVNTSDGEVNEQLFTLRGIYATQFPSYDEVHVFMPLAKAQAITLTENHASIIFVLLHDQEQTQAVVDALQTSQYQVKTWEEMNLLLVQTEQFSRAYMVLFYLIVLAITATVIVNTLVMAVFERTREIGILSALGMRGTRVIALFFAESSLLTLGGIVLGLVIGGIAVAYAAKYGFYIGDFGTTGILIRERLYGYLIPSDVITLTIIAFIVTLLGSLYPALLAARLDPVEALRGGK